MIRSGSNNPPTGPRPDPPPNPPPVPAPAFDRAYPTHRRERAVELLLASGWKWHNNQWVPPNQCVEIVWAGGGEGSIHDYRTHGGKHIPVGTKLYVMGKKR